jgi:hypothetical protein
MIALVVKELREGLKWALLAMIVLGGAELYALYPHNGQQAYYDYVIGGITLCRTQFLTATTFGCAVVGFLLGLIQILPELKRDRWAALLHRPVSRGVIFRGKCVAGLFLYSVATVPPFLFAVWLVATPGNFGVPFVPEMVFPGTVDICAGAVYYFAALGVSLQRGGWIGLRVLPLLAAIHVSYDVLNEKLFYVSVEAAVLMALALFTAAWGEMHDQDLLRARPWLGRLAFLAVVFYGVCGLGDLGHSVLMTMSSSGYSNFDRYELSEGVTLHIVYGKGGVVVAVEDLDGNAMTDPKFKPDRVRNHLMYLNDFSDHVGDSHGSHPWMYQPTYREARSYLFANNPTSYPRVEQWFELVRQRYLIGYLPEKKAAFAILDQRGFRPATDVPQPIVPEVRIGYAGEDAYCLWDSNHATYAYTSRLQTVDLVLPVPAPIYGIGTAFGSHGNGSVNIVGLVLGTGLAVYDDKAALVTTLPYHQDVSRWGNLSLGINGTLDRFYLRYDPSSWISDATKKTMPSFVEEMDRQGRVLHAYTLPPLPNHPEPRTWENFLTHRIQSPAFFFGTILYKKIGAELGSSRLQGDLNWQFGHDRSLTREISHYALIVALLLAVATLVWARFICFSWPRAWAWTAFVFAFGLPGFITFRLAADWPEFVACFSCGKSRPVEAGRCPHCQAGWPAPTPTGIEIFDQPRSQAPALASP